jgi:uncharacterized protein
MAAPPWHARDDGLEVTVRLTPRSNRDEIDGIETLADGRPVLKVRVRAIPEAGAANAALLRLLAESLRRPASSLNLESGATARLKTVHIAGNANELARGLQELCYSKSGKS